MRALAFAVFLLVLTGAQPCSAQPGHRDGRTPPAEPPAAEDRVVFLRTLTVGDGETVRDAVCILCSVVVRGTVERDAVAVWGGIDVEAHGRVGADAVAAGGGLRVAPGGHVGKEPVAVGGPVEVASGGTLLEEATALPWLHFAGQRQLFPFGVTVFVGAHLLLALLASLLLGERRIAHLTAVGLWRRGRTLLLGLVVFGVLVSLIAWVASLVPGSETAVGIVGGLVLGAALALGLPPLALALGRRRRPGRGWTSSVLVGTLAIAGLSLVPLAGLLVSLLVWGAVCGLTLRGLSYRRTASKASAPSGSGDDVLRYYALGLEKDRLDEAYFPLERTRTRELIERHLPPPPGTVLDIGGAAGAYSFWLAERGYEVHLVDPVPLHIEQAEQAGAKNRLASARVGDARTLDLPDASADAVLLLGPLYHLTGDGERRTALGEAHRVLRPEGWLFAAAISRFASLLDGLRGFVFEDEAFRRIVEQDLTDGQHRNDTDNPLYFTTAFFHHPEGLSAEIREGGFVLEGVYAVEGPGAFLPDFERRWSDRQSRERLLGLLRRVEREPALLGASPHLLAVGRKPSA